MMAVIVTAPATKPPKVLAVTCIRVAPNVWITTGTRQDLQRIRQRLDPDTLAGFYTPNQTSPYGIECTGISTPKTLHP